MLARFQRLVGPNKELQREEPVGRSHIAGWKVIGAHLAPPPSGAELSLPSRGFCVSAPYPTECYKITQKEASVEKELSLPSFGFLRGGT